ncbi:hypothetical protein [Flavobacterium sp.]|jgi:hypothetical protein|uniref:hypothetical protein n=1 Tax=Flavobacterium sp. TaxID=239 RepID=UPI0037C0B15C
MRTKITLLVLFFSLPIWSQTSSGTGTSTSGNGGGAGIKVTISSALNSNSIEILPDLDVANVIGYKIYNSHLELKKDVAIAPTNNETIVVDNIENDRYYIQLLLDQEEESKWIISKQFIKE